MAKLHVRLVGVVLSAALGLAVPAQAVAPADIVGGWAGTWKNLKFKSTGNVTATVSQPDANSLSIQFDVTGSVFGCSAASNTLTLTKGVDYTDTSVDFTRTDPVFGNVTVASTKKGQKLKGGGTAACNGAGRVPSWKFTAKLKGTTLTMKFMIKLSPKGKAKSIATVSKQA